MNQFNATGTGHTMSIPQDTDALIERVREECRRTENVGVSYGAEKTREMLDGFRALDKTHQTAFARIEQLQAEVERLETMLDPAICRRQFPDGGVPGNIAECAEGWKRNAERFWEERDQIKARLSDALAATEALRPTVELVVEMAKHGLWPGRPGDIECAKAALAALPQQERGE